MSGEVREELVKFIQVLIEDEELRGWFDEMSELPAGARSAEFTRMAGEMERAGEHPELITATALLANADLFDAVAQTLNDSLGR